MVQQYSPAAEQSPLLAMPPSDVNQIEISPEAEAHFAKMLARSGKSALRLSLKEAGCTGFKYLFSEVDAAEPLDLVKSTPQGLQVYIDSRYWSALAGTRFAMVQQGVNWVLKIDNPNVKESCGCGESFYV
jgi:iron-sulfur cluster assembly accessory protein